MPDGITEIRIDIDTITAARVSINMKELIAGLLTLSTAFEDLGEKMTEMINREGEEEK